MAIDKSRTSPLMKTGVIILIVAFVLGIGGTFSYVVLNPQPSVQPSTTATANTQLEQLGAQSKASIDSLKAQLATKPKDYDTLKSLGDKYYDWALGVKQISPNAGLDAPLWTQAADYYKQALVVKPGDPNVETDRAIALFYSGDTKGAIVVAEGVRAKSPKFAPAPFNLGIFYANTGDVAKATAALNDYLKLEPNGQNADAAKNMLSQLKSAPPATQSSPATGQ